MIEYFALHLWQLWALVAVLCLILELTNGDFFIMCFSLGAAVSAVVSLFGVGFYANLAVFAIVSVLCIFFVRPFALKYLHKAKDERKSNAEALIGKEGVVVEAVPAQGFGYVAVDGDQWRAHSLRQEALEKGARVRIVRMESIIVTVERA